MASSATFQKGPQVPSHSRPGRLEFAAFSVKSMRMGSTGNGIGGCGHTGRLFPLIALVLILAGSVPGSVAAQMFSDRPPPVPPAVVPDVVTGPAMNLAPPAGPGSIPNLPAPL